MTDKPVILGLGRFMLPIPPAIWKLRAARGGRHDHDSLAFMTPEHHRVRNYAVLELPRQQRPLEPEFFAVALHIPLDRVVEILDDLERHMTFLFRSDGRAVDWAYPVTLGPTPHHLTFSTGERIDAA